MHERRPYQETIGSQYPQDSILYKMKDLTPEVPSNTNPAIRGTLQLQKAFE